MRKRLTLAALAAVLASVIIFFILPTGFFNSEYREKEDEYQELIEREKQLFEQLRDPVLNTIPLERLHHANETTQNLRTLSSARGSLAWTERGPIFDTVGPSNGNSRAGFNYTAGMMPTFLVDTYNDPSGNTVFGGSSGGGLWKCTNFLSNTAPNWQPVNDYMANLAIASICQDPSNPSIMYLATGDGNTRDVRGYGIWKSTDAGTTWAMLPSTTSFTTAFKIICDNSGNVYVATGGLGLRRSTDGGTTWVSISPTGNTASNASYVTDLELSSTGRLHASFGLLGTAVRHYYTDVPATASSGSGWNLGTGIRLSGTACTRMELAVQGDVVYAITSNSSYNIDSTYKSTDGGVNWTKQNTAGYTGNLGQGWYNLTLQINPDNANEIVFGAVDGFRSTNSGATISTYTNWVSTPPYVHADHHYMLWFKVGSESRIIIAGDGGMFLSRDGGATWRDRNQNLAIKQFYSCAIHPTAGTNYFLAGSQDNGSHQLKHPGRSSSIEVTGGDGAFVHINQADPTVQFTSYIFNQYRRSTNGGANWSSVNLSSSLGYFINPFDYDDAQNIMYASNASSSSPNNAIRRWVNANSGSTNSTITISDLVRSGSNSNASAFKVSPHTANRLFVGGSSGKLLRIEDANNVTTGNVSSNVTDITGASFPSGYLNCINVGTSDQYLVAVFTNYGVDNIWYSSNGGSSWTAIDGNLPDMPVWWAVFEPGTDNRLIIATETGVFTTDNVNGTSTVWTGNPAFPLVRTTMLKVRASDNTILASTYGRGLFTATIPSTITPDVNFTTPATAASEDPTGVAGCSSYRDYNVNVSLVNPATGNATVTYTVQGGNTAVLGRDFDFTTNGNFTTPSDQHTFASGTTGVRTVTVRIYDDTEVETTKTFTLGFSISGVTNAQVGNSSATHTFTITDNDAAPVGGGNVIANIGLGNTNLTQPFRGQFSDSRTQMVFLASELTAAGFTAGTINSFSLNVTAKNSTAPYNGFTIRMKNTTTASMTGGAFESGATTVYGPVNYSTTAGVNSFTLSTPFVWDGTSNLMLEFCYDNVTGTATDNVAGTSGLPRCQFERVDGAAGCSIANAGFQFGGGGARPDVNFNMTTLGTPIATTMNTSRSLRLYGSGDQYVYSATGEILARINNLQAHDYGCTQVTIDRDGTAAGGTPFAKPFWNNTPANFLTAKTWHVVPTTNNSSGQYLITLYYTDAEKTGWETATGQSWSNIKIVKVVSQIKNYSPATPAPDGANAVEIVTPVIGTFGSHHTLTFTFNTGFSGFAAGVPGVNTLPVTLTTFQGRLDNNNKNILLEWSTSSEQNSRDFEVEKSTNGVSYYKIGTVAAAGNSSTRRNYTLTDPQVQAVNYYRLKMNDLDGKSKHSQVVVIRNNAASQSLWIVNNPFKNHIDLRLALKPQSVRLQLVSMNGAIVADKIISNPSEQIRWDLQTSAVSKGAYLLRAIVDGKTFTEKLIKE